jgi:hypothetical protein
MSRWIAVPGLMLLACSAWAHHNMSASFDMNHLATLNGTLSKIDWRNPHIELFVDINGNPNQLETWSVEGPAPVFFRDRDINKSDIESALGKTVVVEVSPARDGSKWGLLRTLTLPGGKVVSACPQNC